MFTYDNVGNIKSKTGVGTGNYVYPAQGAASVRPNGAGRTVTWTSYDMPERIGGPVSSSMFVYGPEHQRVRQERSDGTVLIYAGAQEVEKQGTTVRVKTYWPMGLGMESERAGVSELHWVHADRLGSPIAYSDQSGNLTDRLGYAAWGKRRTPSGTFENGTDTPDSVDGKIDSRGFTGHEMLEKLELVHMNGRMFDPLVGRFMSADPLIEDPMNGQSYNRYSYVLNNPMNLTDPTGFSSCATPNVSDNCANAPKVEIKGTKEAVVKEENFVTRVSTSGSVAGGNLRVNVVGTRGNKVDAKLGGSANTTARAQPGRNYGDHYAEYKKEVPFSGGDGPSTNAMGYDDWALGKGYMTKDQWSERAAARGTGAAVGIGIAVTGVVAAEAAAAGGLMAGIKNMLGLGRSLSKEAERSIKLYERPIREHERKFDDFRPNPTVRPGMENPPRDVTEKAQGRRIRHLQAEIQKFKDNLDKLRNGN